MSRLINVRRDVSDSFYRYKMEPIQTKVEGKGNGIKTVVPNLNAVAQQLERPGHYLIKFFGFELGAQTTIDTTKDDRWIINGAHESSKLQDLLDIFIKKFVLCHKCKNPETRVEIKDGRITLDCKACGVRSAVDLRHKLSGYILKQQPSSKKTKKDKAERRAARIAKQNGQANGDGSNDEEDKSDNSADKENGESGSADGDNDIASDDDAFTRKIKAEAQEIKNGDKEVKDHEWAVDMSEEAVRARQQQLPGEFKQKLVLNGDDEDEDGEGGGNTVYDQLAEWIEEQAAALGSLDKVEDVDVYVKAKELGIESKHRTVLVLACTLFDDKIITQIPKRVGMLKKMIGGSERHEKALLGGTERLVGEQMKENPEFVTKIVKILGLYYQNELAEEEVLKKWGSKASKKNVDLATSRKIRKAAEPFMTWLEEAEEEDSDDDDE